MKHLLAALAAAAALPVPAAAQDHAHGDMAMPTPVPDADPAAISAHAMPMGMGDGAWVDSSGTARLPADEGGMRGPHLMTGEWMLMAHGYAWGVVTDQGGPRGHDGAFVASMAMLAGERDLGSAAHLQLRAMGSLDPLMGPRGYPNLFATGETANGRPLVDRQHPHDLFIELSGRLDYRLGDRASLFLYGGPVAEPALGPAAFMHRGSARYLPMAPITHHWFDSTHITYGVATAGYAGRTVQLEGSAFRGAEPDERRWNLEQPRLDSWSVRATWTPSPRWALQLSHGFLRRPERQHDEDERRTTASAHYARGGVTATLAWALKDRVPGRALPALLGEVSWEAGPRHTLFGRVEHVANDELFPDEADPRHDRVFHVAKAEAGYAYRLPLAGPVGVALGGTVAAYAKPAALDEAYGDAPVSWTLFAKLVLGL